MENIIIIGLLAALVVGEFLRTYNGLLRSVTKKDHFKAKLRQTRVLIWDLQFKVFKTREVREDIRQEYDYMKARAESIQGQIDAFPADRDPSEKGKLKDDLVIAQRDTERLLKQMEQLDIEIEGAKPSPDYPNGMEGVTHQIDSLRELEKMLEDYVKEL